MNIIRDHSKDNRVRRHLRQEGFKATSEEHELLCEWACNRPKMYAKLKEEGRLGQRVREAMEAYQRTLDHLSRCQMDSSDARMEAESYLMHGPEDDEEDV